MAQLMNKPCLKQPMPEKTIKEVVTEFKEAFGMVEFMAVHDVMLQTITSQRFKPAPVARFEITGDDYIAMGQLNAGSAPPSEGVLGHFIKLSLGAIHKKT